MEVWIQKTLTNVRIVCSFDATVRSEDVELRVQQERLEWINIPGMDAHELARCLGVNLNFAHILKGIALGEVNRREEIGIISRCNPCDSKFGFAEELRRHNKFVHGRTGRRIKKEVKDEEGGIIVDSDSEDGDDLVEAGSQQVSEEEVAGVRQPSKKIRVAQEQIHFEGDAFIC